jgi:hypothetical protein
MALPIRTTLADVDAICAYLVTKPTGATVPEAKAVLNSKVLDPRKINALRIWGLLDDSSGKMVITDRGRLVGKDKGARRAEALREVVASIPPYRSIVERAVHRDELTLSAVDVAAHWHQHFKADASANDKILNDQAVCFFQVAEGADLGKLVIGRKGQPTRFEFDEANARALAEGAVPSTPTLISPGEPPPEIEEEEGEGHSLGLTKPDMDTGRERRVFITHGKNKQILDQIKEVVELGGFEPVISTRTETTAKPIPDKVMDDMRSCSAAVIHVGSEGILTDEEGATHPHINPNVLIEIGAAMALYKNRYILVVEEGVTLPSNLQGLYESRYSGSSIEFQAGMRILKALRGLKSE